MPGDVAMPGGVATLDDRIGRARVVGWSVPDTVDAPACLLPGLAADARWWCELLAGAIATIMMAAAASTAAAATAAPACRCRRKRRCQVPRRAFAFGKPSYPNGPARCVTLVRCARPAGVLSAQALRMCPGSPGGSVVSGGGVAAAATSA
jgi:hypothetical protein